MRDLEFDPLKSLKVKSNGAVGLTIYDFLLVPNSNYMSNSHHLGVIASRNFSAISSLCPKILLHNAIQVMNAISNLELVCDMYNHSNENRMEVCSFQNMFVTCILYLM